jgi:hypothetical protein
MDYEAAARPGPFANHPVHLLSFATLGAQDAGVDYPVEEGA